MEEGTLKTQSLNVVFTGNFCLGWCGNFVGSESGQKQSVKLLRNMVDNTTQYPPQTATHCLYIPYVYFGKGSGGGQREGRKGQQCTRGFENTNMTDCTVSPICTLYLTPVTTAFRVWFLNSSFVHGGYSSQAGSKIPTMNECISSL
jgi:hypothetical protein